MRFARYLGAALSAILVLLFGVIAVPVFAVTDADPAAAARTRIIVAGRQRMLTQLMTKSTCFAMIGIDAQNQAGRAFLAAMEFDTTLQSLIHGGPDGILKAETDPEVRAILQEVARLSAPMTLSVRQIASGDAHNAALTLLLEKNLKILTRMDAAVGIMARNAGAGPLSVAEATTLNLAGRQRMLSQVIAKSVCLVAVGLDGPGNKTALDEAIVLFEENLHGLRHGNLARQLRAGQTPEIQEALRLTSQAWDRIKDPILRLAAEGKPDTESLTMIAQGSDTLLLEMDRAVTLMAAQGT